MLSQIKEHIIACLRAISIEAQIVFKDSGILLFVIGVPLLYPILYSICYNPEIIREVPITVVDNSRSSRSREYIRKLDATPNVHVIGLATDTKQAQDYIKKQKTYGYIVIPAEFAKDINRGKQSCVSVYCDMSGMLYYQQILTANTNVTLDMNNHIRLHLAGNTTQRQDELTTAPIQYEEVTLFNSSGGMASYLLPAVLIIIIQQTLFLGIGMASGTAREDRRKSLLFQADNPSGKFSPIFAGGVLFYFIIEIFNTAFLTLFIPYLFNLNQIIHIGTLAAFVLPYILACIFFSILLGTLVRNREVTMLLFVFTSVPLLFISGISWPGAAVPGFWKAVSYIFPSTFAINGFVRINAEYATLDDVRFEHLMLWIQCLVYLVLAYAVGLRSYRKMRKEKSCVGNSKEGKS